LEKVGDSSKAYLAILSIDAEVLANKISSAASDLYKLDKPSQSSLSTLGTNQWLLSDILT